MTNFSYSELTASFIRALHKIRCLLNTVSWQTNVHLINYRVAVGLLVGQGCERSELPCLANGITKQGRRSWSFYMYHTCCLLDRQICGQMPLANDIVFGHWFPQTDSSNVKRPRPTALKDNMHRLGRVAHFVRNPALPTDQPLRGS